MSPHKTINVYKGTNMYKYANSSLNENVRILPFSHIYNISPVHTLNKRVFAQSPKQETSTVG